MLSAESGLYPVFSLTLAFIDRSNKKHRKRSSKMEITILANGISQNVTLNHGDNPNEIISAAVLQALNSEAAVKTTLLQENALGSAKAEVQTVKEARTMEDTAIISNRDAATTTNLQADAVPEVQNTAEEAAPMVDIATTGNEDAVLDVTPNLSEHDEETLTKSENDSKVTESEKPVESSKNGKKDSRSYEVIEISKLWPDPFQPRKIDVTNLSEADNEALQHLTDSVKSYGILQPILVSERDGKVVIVAGERRYQAAIRAGLKKVPVIFTNGDQAALGLIENCLRLNLSVIEEAEALKRLKDSKPGSYSGKELAKIIGKSQQTVSEILKLNLLPQDIRDKYRSDRVMQRDKLLTFLRNLDGSEDVKDVSNAFRKFVTADKNSYAKTDEPDKAKESKESVKPAEYEVALKIFDKLIASLTPLNLKDLEQPVRENFSARMKAAIKIFNTNKLSYAK
jgi:ParB family chromosome partitioning protein